jgi:hypothetical protein
MTAHSYHLNLKFRQFAPSFSPPSARFSGIEGTVTPGGSGVHAFRHRASEMMGNAVVGGVRDEYSQHECIANTGRAVATSHGQLRDFQISGEGVSWLSSRNRCRGPTWYSATTIPVCGEAAASEWRQKRCAWYRELEAINGAGVLFSNDGRAVRFSRRALFSTQ